MVDPTWIHTCPCGAKVRVNQLGQHHHTNCEFDPLSPGCCPEPELRRDEYHTHESAVTCQTCGETWDTDG